MNHQILKKPDLKPGDIFLCVFEHPGAEAYFEALLEAIKYYQYKNDDERRKFLESALVILRGLIITFDEDIYTHAAFWNGEKVVEAGLSGVKANPIEHYQNTITDVFRFIKDGQELGSDELSTAPLLKNSQDLIDQNLSYSYETAYLYILLCITRWKREEWIQEILNFLKAQIPENQSRYIEFFFEAYHDKIVLVFEWMADEMIRQIVKYRNDDGLVCSETVAKIYNEAKPVGKYHIEKPLTSALSSSSFFEQPSNQDFDEQILKNLIDSIENLEIRSTGNNASVSWENVIDIEYTPHDLARSKNTFLAGRLDLD